MKKGDPSKGIRLVGVLLVPTISCIIATKSVIACELKINNVIPQNDIKNEYLMGESTKVFNNDSMVNIYVDAYSVELNDNFVGYIANEEESEAVLNKVKDKYINKLKNVEDKIQNTTIETDLKLMKKSIRISDISNLDNIVENILILNKCKEKPLVKIEITTLSKELVDIDSPIKIINTDEIFVGESKVEEGEIGKKEIVKRDKFINGRYEGYDILDENILVNPTETVVYKGTKSPVALGLKFLQHPTRGGVITSNFGMRAMGNHRGIDIGVPTGTPIGVACDGVVKYVGYDSIYGNMVIVKHSNDIETAYAHVSKIIVKVGQNVKKGETIAQSGNTGRSTGPHLHFELRVNGEAINPNKYIKNI